MFSNITENWTVRNISNVYYFQEGPGVRKWQFRDKGIKLLNGSNINNGTLDLSNTKIYLDEQEANGKYKHFLVDEGDLVIASSGIVVENFHNKIAFVKKEHLPLCMNTSTIRFKALDNKIASLQFLKFFLKTNFFKTQIGRLITGSAQLNFGPSHLEKVKIPLPPLTDQLRIAAVLTRAEKLIAKRKESIRLLDDYLKSSFLEMFGDPVRNEKGWERIPLSKVLLKIESGHSPVCLDRPTFPGEWGVLKLGAVTQCIYKPDHNKALPDSEKPNPDIEIKVGDVLFTRKNTYDLVAACAYVWDTPPKLMMSDLIFRLVPRDKNSINSIFLQALLSSFSKRKMIQRLAGGAAGSMPNISKTKLLEHEIEVPPLPLQNKFAALVEKVESLKAKFAISLKELENLYGSLSQRAFKGELDLSRVVVEEEESTELQELENKEEMTSRIFSENTLRKLIEAKSDNFSFSDLWEDLQKESFQEMPQYEQVKEILFLMLSGEKPFLKQTFEDNIDKKQKEIVLSINR